MNRYRLFGLFLSWFSAAVQAGDADWLTAIDLPSGFRITLFSQNTPNARSLALGEDGTVYVGTTEEGKVYALPDSNRDGRADVVYTLATGLNMPNGVAMLKGDLYVAEISRIIRFRDIANRLSDPPKPEVFFDGFPSDRHHGWKYLRVGPDGNFYVAVGAPCNICLSEKPVYASLLRLDGEGKNLEIFAQGIRNTVGFDWHPANGELFFSDNGRDWLGDDLPPDELNRATKAGLHFGYPYCHAGIFSDPEYGSKKSCAEFVPPVWKFPAHVAPLGIRFYRGKQFPDAYQGQLFVAQHGSWNRSQPQGYRLALVRFKDGAAVSEEPFAEGWLQAGGKVLGRPVDVLELADGSLLVSDDRRGAVYRIHYDKP